MSLNWRVSPREMRKMLNDRVAVMRKIRAEVLNDGQVKTEQRQAYLEQVVQAASFADSFDDPAVTDRIKGIVMEAYNSDCSLPTYDVTQDKWWKEQQAVQFLTSLRKLSLYFLRGGLSSNEDAFHVFQMLKHLYETDRDERRKEMFMRPAYGSVYVPEESGVTAGNVIVTLTKNKLLTAIEDGNRLALKLNWYPDDSELGMSEVRTLLEKAAHFGFTRVEFWLPDIYKYEQLTLEYSSRMQSRIEGGKCIVSIKCKHDNGATPNKTLQLLEYDNRRISEVRSELNGLNMLVHSDNGFSAVACHDDCGIEFGRFLFAIDDGELSVRGGLYLPQKPAIADMLMREITTLTGEISADSVNALLMDIGNKLNAMVAYATIRRGEIDEHEIEAVGDSFYE